MNVVFKEWLPDQPALGNPGLTVATNVIPAYGSYQPFYPLSPVRSGSFTLPGIPSGGFVAELESPNNPAYIYYAATSSNVYMANAAVGQGTFNSRSSGWSTTSPLNDASFAQYENLVFLARGLDGLQVQTAGSASNFATVSGMTGTRDARYVFVIGQFVVVANMGSSTVNSARLEWSAIDDPTNFPTPGSSTAIASQAGGETLNFSDGPIVGGYGGDQYGVIVQTGAITRMTYVGPPAVFQFDRIEGNKGSQRRYGSAVAGRVVYMQASDGFYKTDGVSVVPIGAGRVDKTFISSAADDIGAGAVTAGAMVDAAYNLSTRCMYWAYAEGSTTNANKILAYSLDEDRWTKCDQVLRTFIEPSPSSSADGLYAFNSSNVLCKFAATAGTAVLTTGEMELNEGGRAFVSGVKPHIESSATAPSITVRVGARDSLGTTPSYSSAVTPTTRTGFADFRSDGKYHRAEISITGNFDKALGLEFNAVPSGSA